MARCVCATGGEFTTTSAPSTRLPAAISPSSRAARRSTRQLPDTHRWIPKGLEASYLKKATGTLTAVATVEDLSALTPDEARDVVVPVEITDPSGASVVRAAIGMWVSPR